MLGVLAGLREIRVRTLDHRILISMSELQLQANIPRNFMILGFGRALRCILVNLILCHESAFLR